MLTEEEERRKLQLLEAQEKRAKRLETREAIQNFAKVVSLLPVLIFWLWCGYVCLPDSKKDDTEASLAPATAPMPVQPLTELAPLPSSADKPAAEPVEPPPLEWKGPIPKPVSSHVINRIEATCARDWPDLYTAQEACIRDETDSANALKILAELYDKGSPRRRIADRCIDSIGPPASGSWALALVCFEENLEAYDRLHPE